MVTTLLTGFIGAVLGTFGAVAGYWLYRRKHTAEARTVELSNEDKIREIYAPIIESLREAVEYENTQCAKKMTQMQTIIEGMQERMESIEANCVGGCFQKTLKKVK
jgi:hypothetical protein